VVVDAQNLTPRPSAVPWQAAGALFVAGSTAYAAVRAVTPAEGDVLAVSGAAGGVGTLAVQLARNAGATVIAKVIVVSPSDTGIRQARAKTDRLDARTLVKLLAVGELDSVWVPDHATWVMRRRWGAAASLCGRPREESDPRGVDAPADRPATDERPVRRQGSALVVRPAAAR